MRKSLTIRLESILRLNNELQDSEANVATVSFF